jgi:DNA helicase MCM8
MKSCLWQAYQDEAGNLDFSRSQNGAGMSKKGDPKKFIAHLSKLSRESGVKTFSATQLYDIALQLGVNRENIIPFIDSLNTHGYLLKTGPTSFKLVNYY